MNSTAYLNRINNELTIVTEDELGALTEGMILEPTILDSDECTKVITTEGDWVATFQGL